MRYSLNSLKGAVAKEHYIGGLYRGYSGGY